MAKVYGKIGSLEHLLGILRERGVYEFATLDEIRLFRNGYKTSLEKLRKEGEETLKKEILNLESEYKNLDKEIGAGEPGEQDSLKARLRELYELLGKKKEGDGLLNMFTNFFKRAKMYGEKEYLENLIAKKIASLVHMKDEIEDKKNNPDKWIEKYSSAETMRLERALAIFKENRHLFYGAEGEEKVVSELSRLSDAYSIINNCNLQFHRPIYDRRNDDRIYSIQVDHIVIGPTGIYLIETKNWSKESIQSLDLFSPVKQLRRHSFAIFVLLNQAVEGGEIPLFSNHWGDRKISTQNILCLTGHRLQQEFQYVKILSLNELFRHVSYGKQIYSEREVQSLTNYLLHF